jgi:N-acetylmuramoyl-L-alanine amidase
MRKIIGFAVIVGLLMVGYGLHSNGDTVSENDGHISDEAAEMTAESLTPVPTLPIEAAAGQGEAQPVQQSAVPSDGDRCFDGQANADTVLSGMTIIVDPGHGGVDLGTVNSRFGLNESDLALSISHLLRERLMASGADVCMTRITDRYVSLADRAYFANDNDGDAFVSVHLNSVPDTTENYTMTMWGNEAKDHFLAETVLEVLRTRMATPEFHNGEANPMNPNIYAIDDLDSYMLKTSEMPAVLVEASCLSNDWEAQVLLDGIEDGTRWREHQIADAIHTGLVQYFEAFE